MTTPTLPAAEATAPATDDFLVVEGLTVKFPTEDGLVNAVTDLSYSLRLGSTLGIVGESGSGKSVSSMTILGLHDRKTARIEGSITLGGTEIIGMSEEGLRKVRGNEAAMIFQDALAALHPFYKIGRQLEEAYGLHHPDASSRERRTRAVDMLGRVGIPQPDRRINDFPHQFSGGMRQRVMIAMALINDPKLLIADEPTTALDVTVQAQILDLLQDLQREFNSAIMMITHDLGVIAEVADDVMVMYAGRAVEYGPCKTILTHPEMPYTWGLLSSIPDLSAGDDARLIPIPGTPPSLLRPPPGCSYHPRCPFVAEVPGELCRTSLPPLSPSQEHPGHLKRCHLADASTIYRDKVLAVVDPTSTEVQS